MLTNHDDVNIVNVDRLSHGSNPANLQDIKQMSGRYEFVKGDINDFESVRDLAKDTGVIVNFAAETHVDRSIPNPSGFHQSNTAGVVTLLEVCRLRDLRFLQVSTDEVYGSAKITVEEAFPMNRNNPPRAAFSAIVINSSEDIGSQLALLGRLA